MPVQICRLIALSVCLQVTLQYVKPCRGRVHYADEDPNRRAGWNEARGPLEQTASRTRTADDTLISSMFRPAWKSRARGVRVLVI